MTKLEWCRANAPDALRGEDDEIILEMMSSSYERYCNQEKETYTESSAVNEENNYLDRMVQILSHEFGDNLAFKGGYMLTKLIPDYARQTTDIDFSIQSSELYNQLLQVMSKIGDEFVKDGYIERYTLKDCISKTLSGGMDMYSSDGSKVLGIDVGWHDLTYGLTTTSINVGSVTAFTVERMLSDKIKAILSRKRFRRSKDIYDLYCITNCFNFNAKIVNDFMLKGNNQPEWQNFPFSEEVIREYEKAYTKLRLVSIVKNRELPKPKFTSVLERFNTICYKLMSIDEACVWNHEDFMFYKE